MRVLVRLPQSMVVTTLPARRFGQAVLLAGDASAAESVVAPGDPAIAIRRPTTQPDHLDDDLQNQNRT
jgi:hypothetical protein